MPEPVTFPHFIEKKGTERQISNMQNIRMAEPQAPPENMSHSQLGMHTVHRMFQAEERKDT